MKVDALIFLRYEGDDASPALQSVLNNAEYVKRVIIVCDYYDAGTELFKGFTEIEHSLKQSAVPIQIVPSFDYDDCAVLKSSLVMEIPFDCVVKTSAFQKFQQTLDELRATRQYNRTHVAQSTSWIETSFSPWHGFLLVSYYFDYLWRLYSRGKKFFQHDIKLTTVCSTHNRVYVARESRWLSKLWNRTHVPCIPGINSAHRTDQKVFRDFRARTIGFWVIGFFFFYVFAAYPWWNPIFDRTRQNMGRYSMALYREFNHPLTYAVYAINVLFMAAFSFYSCKVPYQWTHIFLHPLYLTLWPLLWFLARF